jgi:hypothetical protein
MQITALRAEACLGKWGPKFYIPLAQLNVMAKTPQDREVFFFRGGGGFCMSITEIISRMKRKSSEREPGKRTCQTFPEHSPSLLGQRAALKYNSATTHAHVQDGTTHSRAIVTLLRSLDLFSLIRSISPNTSPQRHDKGIIITVNLLLDNASRAVQCITS